MNTTPQYDDSYKKLIATLKAELDQSKTSYSQERWVEFIAALHGFINAFEDLKAVEYQETATKTEARDLKTKENKAHNKKVDAEVKKVHDFIQFIQEREKALRKDERYLLGALLLMPKTLREGVETQKHVPERYMIGLLKRLYQDLDRIAIILNSQRTNAFRVTVPKSDGKNPYVTKVLRENLLVALMAISDEYLKIEPTKSSDLKGFNIIATYTLMHVVEITKKMESHNYQEYYASAIDCYRELRSYWLECFQDAHLDGYQTFMSLFEPADFAGPESLFDPAT
jgi:hypothetical protein